MRLSHQLVLAQKWGAVSSGVCLLIDMNKTMREIVEGFNVVTDLEQKECNRRFFTHRVGVPNDMGNKKKG
jgi:hypothetical protein